MTPMEGSSGVERTLNISEVPSSFVRRKSVKVPPTSMPILICSPPIEWNIEMGKRL
jgi:hypothetical protein